MRGVHGLAGVHGVGVAGGRGGGTGRAAARRAAGAAALAAVLAALSGGCDKPAAHGGAHAERSADPVSGEHASERPSAATWAKWGLKPMRPAPPPPVVKPLKLPAKSARVFSNVPTRDRVVFVTIDDGQEKDPRFVEMLRELKVPVSMFLTDQSILDDYGYFKPIRDLGDHVQNHTLTHPQMTTLGLEGQRQQICGDQKVLTRHYGTAPILFRPPFGSWNSLTQQAAASCGVHGIVLWKASMQIHDMQYDDPGKKLYPGDVLLAHFRGPDTLKGESMTRMFAHMLKHIRSRGFAVARLEDYVQAPDRPR